jgi:hypothetical protein
MKVMAKKRVENPNYQNDSQVSTTFSMFLGSYHLQIKRSLVCWKYISMRVAR